LHVLKGTDLAADYEAGRFECLTLDEYVDIVKDAIRLLPKDMVIHRMTGDGDKKLLIAPVWSGNKKLVLNTLNKALSLNL
jgi:radical SAM superfamily enzyme